MEKVLDIQSEPEPEPASIHKSTSTKRWSSVQLANALQQKDKEAILYLHQNLGGKFLGWMCKKGGHPEDVPDIIQTAILEVVITLDRNGYTESGNFEGYFFKVAMNIFYNRLKVKAKRQETEAAYQYQTHRTTDLTPTDLHEEEKEYQEKAQQAQAILNQLKEEQRTVFLLRVEKTSFKKISQQMNRTVAAVKMLHKRAKDNIEKLVNKL